MYDEHSKAYMLYHMPIKIVKISRDGVFNGVKLFLTSNLVNTLIPSFGKKNQTKN